jgi:hypothetical protein
LDLAEADGSVVSPEHHVDHHRRRLLAGGSAVVAGAWVAPSVLTLDRVAAATGSCGAAPIQVDWSDYATNSAAPSSVTANDGTIVTLSSSDPFDVAGPRHFTARTEPYGGVQGFLASEMVGGNNGEYVEITLAFSKPVQLCFILLDVDRRLNRWEDTVILNGTLSAVPVTLTSADIVTGPANTFVADNTIRGILDSNTPVSSADANATITYPSEIDNLVVRHSDITSWTSGQIIGIFDLLWC